MFDSFLKDSFVTQRLVLSSGKKTWTDNLTDQLGMLQPLSDRQRADLGLTAKSMRLFAKRVDIKEQDRVVMGGKTYTIETVDDFNFGSFPHLEITLSEMQ